MATQKKSKDTLYGPEIVEEICSRITEGDTLVEIAKSGLVHDSTIRTWKRKYPAFRDKLAIAYQSSADGIFNKIYELEFNLEDYAIYLDSLKTSEGKKLSPGAITALINKKADMYKETVNNLKWRLKMLNPEKYGDRVFNDVNWKEKAAKLDNLQIDAQIKTIVTKAMQVIYTDTGNESRTNSESDSK